jgi:tetratricopeptide (TPR) repeat protein
LPDGADAHPEIWRWRGEIAARRGQTREAARCLWECVRRDPNHRVALYSLAQLLAELGDAERSQSCAVRAGLLLEYDLTCRLFLFRKDEVELMSQAAAQCEGLGRELEALGWYEAALRVAPDHAAALARAIELRASVRSDAPQTADAANPAIHFDLSSFPLPPSPRPGGTTKAQANADVDDSAAPSVDGSHVEFADRAADLGIDFTYFSSPEPATPGARMFEFGGGGVGIVDFDRDGWPDLYFTQGCQWPPKEGAREHVDKLFRNEGNGSFTEVGEWAGVGDERFGQGIAAGDFNADGFTDLYVANIGQNRLYRNNGDGTFADVTAEARVAGDAWTTSCLMADLNGDGLPDLYDVTYAQAHDVFDRMCGFRGEPGICPPTVFDAQQDRLWLNLGDGRFEAQSAKAGIEAPAGYGLGVVAADFSGTGKWNLIVANDQTANFYFVNQTETAGGAPRFVERGMRSGLALDRNALALACMGVAAGDANGDGLLDLYVTNFYSEPNTLYQQKKSGGFDDVSRAAGLAAPSIPMLGFGTQFLDADLDGRLDLAIANGHIFDHSGDDIPYAMRPQLMYNLGNGKFRELAAETLGKFFGELRLGRGLARLDWNRDGLDDFCVSHLESPVALVSNRTATTNRYISVALAGVASNREALGAIATFKAGNLTQVRHLSAGDGYQASNERRLAVGLGSADVVDEIRVRWPGGGEQVWRDLPANREWLLIEGRAEAVGVFK